MSLLFTPYKEERQKKTTADEQKIIEIDIWDKLGRIKSERFGKIEMNLRRFDVTIVIPACAVSQPYTKSLGLHQLIEVSLIIYRLSDRRDCQRWFIANLTACNLHSAYVSVSSLWGVLSNDFVTRVLVMFFINRFLRLKTWIRKRFRFSWLYFRFRCGALRCSES